MNFFRATFAALVLGAAGLSTAYAADYPNRTVRIIVPWAAGGFTDVLGRALAEKFAKSLGQPVIVENRPGASGAVGSEHVARSPADGYTLLITTSDSTVRLMKDKAIDPVRDFSHVSLVATQPVLLAVGSRVISKDLGEFITMVRAQPDRVTYASSGEGSAVHLAMELFSRAAGIRMIHVPYKGMGPALTDLIGGQVDSVFISIQGAGGHLGTGKLRPLAITAPKRSPIQPEVPTLAESGFSDFRLMLWYALTGPKGIPQDIIDVLNREVKAALASPDLNERLVKGATDPVGSSSEQLRQFTVDEVAKWGPVVN